jgi:ABC-type transport system involved in cytochrome c biogenesis permease subunit
MADAALIEKTSATPADSQLENAGDAIEDILLWLLHALASLKLTVALFAMAIFIVFAGTLAQVEKDIWEAIDGYFRTRIAWIEFQIFFPPSFFPNKPVVPGGFYFPGGWLIGLMMMINLLAAHGLRFKVQSSGIRLATGLLVIAVGMIATWLVIASGSNPDGLQHDGWIDWPTLWVLFEVGIGALWFAAMYTWVSLWHKQGAEQWGIPERMGRRIFGVAAAAIGVFFIWLVAQGDAARLNDSGMRILWQLIKGAFAGGILLAGCVMVFKKRAGIVLLHSGILLMMLNEILVGTMAEEGQMHIRERETVNYVQDHRNIELAVIDRADPKVDDVVAVPSSRLAEGKAFEHELLPCKIELISYLKNSELAPLNAVSENPANTGEGLTVAAVAARAGAGTDSGGKVDYPSAYVKFSARDGMPIGTYLLSAYLDGQPLAVGDKTYEVSLRFKRNYKPYQITLLDVRKDDYVGTDTPRNYSSDVRLVDETRNVDREIKIWMNNPLRFAGETFYQSNYNLDPRTGEEVTGLQVVTNEGWMIPYVGCMIVAVGMLAHFGVVLLRFLNRRAAESMSPPPPTQPPKKLGRERRHDPAIVNEGLPELAARFFPVAVVAIFALYLVARGQAPSGRAGELNLYEFGKIPVVEQGRVKPLDTVARNTLRIISDKQTFTDEDGHRQPAIRWLADVIADPETAEKHRVFRIENMEVLDTLGLQRRAGLRYSLAELRPKSEEFNKQAESARAKNARDLSLYERKILELDRRIRNFTLLQASFQALSFPPLPSEEEFTKDREAVTQRVMRIREMLEAAARLDSMMTSMHPPLAVPVDESHRDPNKRSWQPYSTAVAEAYRSMILGEKPNQTTLALSAIFDAYTAHDANTFNSEVANYLKSVRSDPPVVDHAAGDAVDVEKTSFEAYFNYLQPFVNSAALYLVAFVLACGAWLGWSQPLNRASFWLVAFTLVVHTFALGARIYISGRPPVTNLYSSAVFIGWGCVLLGLVLEVIYRLGIGNVVAAIAGFNTLLISHFLAGDGDTFTVLQAVLDTQFWLATHVVCITLGYATTFVAGLLGALYILIGVCSPALSTNLARTITRMTYGVICFALFFSFVGTVLGGLWADDSWGRFWGWDPKENGALIIVLWNALVLHARWDGMIRDRGLAVLAVGGNIVTSWSWFGVNELGVGLHSYGFTEGVLQSLGLFILSQLVIISMGCSSVEKWWSYRQRDERTLEMAGAD